MPNLHPFIKKNYAMSVQLYYFIALLSALQVFVHVFLDFLEDLKKLEDDEEDVDTLSSAQVANMFVDWTDPSYPMARCVICLFSTRGIVIDESTTSEM